LFQILFIYFFVKLHSYYPKIVELCGHVLDKKHYEFKDGNFVQEIVFFIISTRFINVRFNIKGIKELIIQLLKYFYTNYRSELDLLVSQMKPELAVAITTNLVIQ